MVGYMITTVIEGRRRSIVSSLMPRLGGCDPHLKTLCFGGNRFGVSSELVVMWGRTCNGTASYVKAVRRGQAGCRGGAAGVVSVRSGSVAAGV